MKKKVSFITNSSSSSYLIIGKPIDLSKIIESDFKENEIKCIGAYVNEEIDVFTLRKEMIDILKRVPVNFVYENLKFYQALIVSWDESKIKLKNILKEDIDLSEYEIVYGICDQNATYSKEQFIKYYINSEWENQIFNKGN